MDDFNNTRTCAGELQPAHGFCSRIAAIGPRFEVVNAKYWLLPSACHSQHETGVEERMTCETVALPFL